MRLALTNNLGVNLTSRTASYDTDAQTYFAAMTAQPDATRKGHLNTLIAGLKTDGIWTKLDWLCLLASHDAQSALLNAKNVAKTLAAVNAPTFTVDRGYAGDGSTSYLTFGETFNAAGNSFAQDSASAGAWCNLGSGTTIVTHLSHLGAGRFLIRARADAGNETYEINDTTLSILQANTGSKLGHRAVSREGAALKRGYFNGALVADLTIASVGNPVGNAVTHQGNGASWSADRLATVYFGSAFTATNAGNMHSRLSTYLTAIGAN